MHLFLQTSADLTAARLARRNDLVGCLSTVSSLARHVIVIVGDSDLYWRVLSLVTRVPTLFVVVVDSINKEKAMQATLR